MSEVELAAWHEELRALVRGVLFRDWVRYADRLVAAEKADRSYYEFSLLSYRDPTYRIDGCRFTNVGRL